MGVGNRFVRYLAGLSRPRLVLWCYLLWYLVVLVRYFDPNPRIWLTSMGLSFIVGAALVLNARSGARPAPASVGGAEPGTPAGANPAATARTLVGDAPLGTALGTWAVARFFMAPFCVSSFAALVKGRGFILVFSPHPGEIGAGVLACAGLVAATRAARHLLARAGASRVGLPREPLEPLPEGPVRAVGNG